MFFGRERKDRAGKHRSFLAEEKQKRLHAMAQESKPLSSEQHRVRLPPIPERPTFPQQRGSGAGAASPSAEAIASGVYAVTQPFGTQGELLRPTDLKNDSTMAVVSPKDVANAKRVHLGDTMDPVQSMAALSHLLPQGSRDGPERSALKDVARIEAKLKRHMRTMKAELGLRKRPLLAESALLRDGHTKTPQELRREEEEAAMDRRRELKRMEITAQRLKKAHDELAAAERYKHEYQNKTVAFDDVQATRRGVVDVVGEWSRKVKTVDDANPALEKIWGRKAEREAHFNLDPRQLLKRKKDASKMRESLVAVKHWRVPPTVPHVDVYKTSKISCTPVDSLAAGDTIEELESKQVDRTIWVRCSKGWAPTQIVFPGTNQAKLQLTPEYEVIETSVEHYMLDALDGVTQQVQEALEICPEERLKGGLEVFQIKEYAQAERDVLRRLPLGHRPMLKEIWDSMQQRSNLDIVDREM